MAVQIAEGWHFDVDAGPEWLFLRLRRQGHEMTSEPPVATRGWTIAEEHDRNRLVFEMAAETHLNSYLVGQLILLHKRAQLAGGVFRICGFTERDYRTLEMIRVAERFPNYASREDAVVGRLPQG